MRPAEGNGLCPGFCQQLYPAGGLPSPSKRKVPIPTSLTELEEAAIPQHLELLAYLGTDEAVAGEESGEVFFERVHVFQPKLRYAEFLNSFEDFVKPRASQNVSGFEKVPLAPFLPDLGDRASMPLRNYIHSCRPGYMCNNDIAPNPARTASGRAEWLPSFQCRRCDERTWDCLQSAYGSRNSSVFHQEQVWKGVAFDRT